MSQRLCGSGVTPIDLFCSFNCAPPQLSLRGCLLKQSPPLIGQLRLRSRRRWIIYCGDKSRSAGRSNLHFERFDPSLSDLDILPRARSPPVNCHAPLWLLSIVPDIFHGGGVNLTDIKGVRFWKGSPKGAVDVAKSRSHRLLAPKSYYRRVNISLITQCVVSSRWDLMPFIIGT